MRVAGFQLASLNTSLNTPKLQALMLKTQEPLNLNRQRLASKIGLGFRE